MLPGALDDPVGIAPGYLARAVGAAVEDDDDLVGKGEGIETVGKLALLVAGDDEGGEERGGIAAHAAALATRAHNWQAAAAAAATEIPSIRVPVVRWSKPGPISLSGERGVHTVAQCAPHGA